MKSLLETLALLLLIVVLILVLGPRLAAEGHPWLENLIHSTLH